MGKKKDKKKKKDKEISIAEVKVVKVTIDDLRKMMDDSAFLAKLVELDEDLREVYEEYIRQCDMEWALATGIMKAKQKQNLDNK